MSNFLVQGTFGTQGNFEVVVPLSTGGLVHLFRKNDDPTFPWTVDQVFATNLNFGSASLIQSSFGPGNLEVVAQSTSLLLHFWRDAGPSFTWSGPTQIFDGVGANPCLIQGKFPGTPGSIGNFEVVVPGPQAGLMHFFRDNNSAGFPWNGPTTFGTGDASFEGASLIQSSYGDPGNLEVVGFPVGTQTGPLAHYWRELWPSF